MIEVLDASVAVKWFVQESGRDQALELLARVLEAPRRFAVPDLIWYELSHVLLRVCPDPVQAVRHLGRVMAVGLPVFAATADRCQQAVELARSRGLSGYDAHYIVLAEELGGRWVTFDAAAVKALDRPDLVRCLDA